MTTVAKCRAKGGVNACTNARCPEKLAGMQAFFNTGTTPVPSRQARQQQPATTPNVTVAMQLDAHIHVHREKQTDPDTTWQTVFLKNPAGVPVVFMKLRLGNRRSSNGTILSSGPVLCDIEVNPIMRGQGAALAAMRIVKQQHNADQVWVGDTFSKTGYRMVQRLLEHERVTGEKTVQFHPWLKTEYIHAGYDDGYTFVKDWATMTPEYDVV